MRDIWDEIMFLAGHHWQETEQYQTEPLNPDKELYCSYNDAGFHLQYTARHNGKIAGHAGMYISKSMHTQIMIATEDTWYLLPEYRKGRNALRFLQYVEDDLKKMGVKEITMHAKLANSSARIMEYMGYEFIGKIFNKRIA